MLLEGVHTHLRDMAPVEEEAGKDLALREWRSCSDAGIQKADTAEPGGIAFADTVEEGDNAETRTVNEEDIGRRDPDQVEEDRKLEDTIKAINNRTRAKPQLTSHVQDKQPDPPGRSKDEYDPGDLDHLDCRDRLDPTLLRKTR